MSLLEADLKYIWHPAQQMKDAEVFPPVVIDHGKGCYLYDTEGKEYIDIISSWWCNLLGHCNDEINDAITAQVTGHKAQAKKAQQAQKAGGAQ